MTTADLENLLARLRKLERQNHRLTFIAWGTLALTLALVANLFLAGLRLGRHTEVRADKVVATETETRYLSVMTERGLSIVSENRNGKMTLGSDGLTIWNEDGKQCVHLRRGVEGGELFFIGLPNDQIIGGITAGKSDANKPFGAYVSLGRSLMYVSDKDAYLKLIPLNGKKTTLIHDGKLSFLKE
jgi:hypothetical protein